MSRGVVVRIVEGKSRAEALLNPVVFTWVKLGSLGITLVQLGSLVLTCAHFKKFKMFRESLEYLFV